MQPLSQRAECVSNLELDEWRAGELSAPEQLRVAQHVANCAQCRSRDEALGRQREVFLAEAPNFRVHAERFAAAPVVTPIRPASRVSLGLAAAAAALAALAGLMLRPARIADTRPKGEPHIGFFVKREQSVERGTNGATLYPNDSLRFVYTSDRRFYFAIFNSDARAVSVYFPGGAEAEPVRPGNDVALDFSVQLDEQLGRERIVAVFCPEAFAVEPLRAGLAATGALPPLAAGCHRDVITLNKVARK